MLSVLLSTLCPPAPLKPLTFWRYTNQIIIIIIINYLHHVTTQCAIWCIHAPVRPPSKISTAVKTTCERIAPSKSFLGAVYNRAGYIVVMKFTERHWLALAPSNLQSSQTILFHFRRGSMLK